MRVHVFLYSFVVFLGVCCVDEVISTDKDIESSSQEIDHQMEFATLNKRRYGDDDFQKRLRYFIGKRSDTGDKEKRMRYLLGKRFAFDGNVNKRLRYFLGKRDLSETGKRTRYFIGKRSDELSRNNLEKKMIHILEKQESDKVSPGLEKRMRYFLGKRMRYFLGKRADGATSNSDSENESSKRMRYFLGKRDGTRYFLGKRFRYFLG